MAFFFFYLIKLSVNGEWNDVCVVSNMHNIFLTLYSTKLPYTVGGGDKLSNIVWWKSYESAGERELFYNSDTRKETIF